MSKMPIRNYPITTDNVNNLGGKELILKRMVNHYNALTKVKAKIDDSTPFLGIKKTESEKRRNLNQKEEFRNVREAYKKVSSVKAYVDNKNLLLMIKDQKEFIILQKKNMIKWNI